MAARYDVAARTVDDVPEWSDGVRHQLTACGSHRAGKRRTSDLSRPCARGDHNVTRVVR